MSQECRLVLIIDPNVSYVRRELINTYQSWEKKQSDLIERSAWTSGITTHADLFGNKNILHLDLSGSSEAKEFTKVIKNNPEFSNNDWIGEGVIITLLRSSKPIEDFVVEHGGKIIKKTSTEDVKNKLTSELNLSSETLEYLLYFVGDDYALLLPFINTARTLSLDEQSELTLQDVLLYLPPKPGSVPPWGFIDPLFSGDIQKSIFEYHRIIQNTHELVVLKLLSDNISLLIKSRILKEMRIWSFNDQAEKLNLKKRGQLYAAYDLAKRTPIETAYRLGELLVEAERDMKGESRVPSALRVEKLLFDVHYLLFPQ